MKKIWTLGAFFLAAAAAVAQTQTVAPIPPAATPSAPTPAAPTGPSGVIVFDAKTFDFGKVLQGDLVHHEFTVSNAGSETLIISDVRPSCGCTTAGAWPHQLAPGQAGAIPIQINTRNLSGAIHKTVAVNSNDKHGVVTLVMTGQVTKPIEINPPFARFNLVMGASNAAPAEIKISNRTEAPMTLKASDENGAFRVTDVKELEAGKEFQVTVEALPPFAHGTNATISFSTGWSNYMVRVPAYLTVQQAVMAQPHAITLPAQLDHDTTFRVTLYSVRSEDKFSDPKCSDDKISVSLTNTVVGRSVCTLAAIVPAGYHATPQHWANITVKTTDPDQPVITIPILQSVPYASAQQQPTRIRQPLPAISSSKVAPQQPPPPPAPAAAKQ